MGDKTFNLTWNNHLANLSGLFEGLYKSGSLTDTTLACQGGMLRAHRLVLAACSPYFERVFKEHYGDQPILILKGVPVEEMECLLDFMYRGSINVAEEHLPSLIKTATDLEIRGLSGDQRNDNSDIYSRVETRIQGHTVEPRHRAGDFQRSQPVSYLSKQICGSSSAGINLEEIEDDPMVMEGHEDTFDESSLSKEQIRHVPPPMFQRHGTTFDSQKRPHTSRNSAENEYPRPSLVESSFEENSVLENIKSETNLDCSTDPTVPAIQMNDDSMDQSRINATPPCGEHAEEPSRNVKVEVEERWVFPTAGKERKTTQQKNKAQYKPFPCDLCTLAFTRASHLARHRRVHTGERPFACSLCPRMFARQDKLKQHLDSHLQFPKRRGLGVTTGVPLPPVLGGRSKRGRPRKAATRVCNDAAEHD